MTGFPPHRSFNCFAAQFTTFLVGNRTYGDFGLSLAEIQFLERFSDYVSPKNILVVGNAYGWSTLALALIFPEAKVVGVDIETTGVELTNKLLQKHNLKGIAVIGRSPEDMPDIIHNHFQGTIDLVLIDATHQVHAMMADFTILYPFRNANTLFLFHDILDHNLVPGFLAIVEYTGLAGLLLTRTTSGMGIIYSRLSAELQEYMDCFHDHADHYQIYQGLLKAACKQ